jgi:hypothetical protein
MHSSRVGSLACTQYVCDGKKARTVQVPIATATIGKGEESKKVGAVAYPGPHITYFFSSASP